MKKYWIWADMGRYGQKMAILGPNIVIFYHFPPHIIHTFLKYSSPQPAH